MDEVFVQEILARSMAEQDVQREAERRARRRQDIADRRGRSGNVEDAELSEIV